jgi:hypothetical protein
MLVRRKPVVRVRNILGDDVYGLWHVKRILINQGRRRYVLIPNRERFRTKEGAEYYAYLRTRRFIEGGCGQNQNNTLEWRAALKSLCTAAIVSLMAAAAVQWWRPIRAASYKRLPSAMAFDAASNR